VSQGTADERDNAQVSPSASPPLVRRRFLALLGALPALSVLTAGCSTRRLDGVHLTIATGSTDGVYHVLGSVLADAWAARLGIPRPTVLVTAGSVENVAKLRNREANVAFSQVDSAAEPAPGALPLQALARVHDDYLHVVVRADLPARRLPELRGTRVSIGSPHSGVQLTARRLLAAAGLDPDRDVLAVQLGLNASIEALLARRIDAFFWSGGLPTAGVRRLILSKEVPIRLLDLEDQVTVLRSEYGFYDAGTIPASTYSLGEPVTTLVVRNFLLVPADLREEVAEALTRGLFDSLTDLADANPAARTIGLRSAIGTDPVPLHPGAERFYRSVKKR